MGTRHWPLFDLRIRTPRLELCLPTDDDLDSLIDAYQDGVHDPATMPFLVPWTDTPSPRREREALQWWWSQRANWKPEAWNLTLCCVADHQIVGVQDINAEQFAERRVVSTGSWLGLRHQGQGLGKEMRAAVLHFAFLGLGATRAETGAFDDNLPSLGVTRALGYQPNGNTVKVRRGEPATCLEFFLDREGFERIRRDDITIENLEASLPMFGLGDGP
jgi:RimJ/RimL family protein N-acetyltransferase